MKTKTFLIVLVLGVLFSGHRPSNEPTSGAAMCGKKIEILIYVSDAKVGPGFVSCDVYNEFMEEDGQENAVNAKKLMAHRRKVK